MGVHEGEAQLLILLQRAVVREAPVHSAHHVGLLLAVVDGGFGHVHWLPAEEGRWETWVLSWTGQHPEVDEETRQSGALRPGASLEASLDADGTLFTFFAHQTRRTASSPPRGTGRVPWPGHLCREQGMEQRWTWAGIPPRKRGYSSLGLPSCQSRSPPPGHSELELRPPQCRSRCPHLQSPFSLSALKTYNLNYSSPAVRKKGMRSSSFVPDDQRVSTARS